MGTPLENLNMIRPLHGDFCHEVLRITQTDRHGNEVARTALLTKKRQSGAHGQNVGECVIADMVSVCTKHPSSETLPPKGPQQLTSCAPMMATTPRVLPSAGRLSFVAPQTWPMAHTATSHPLSYRDPMPLLSCGQEYIDRRCVDTGPVNRFKGWIG